MALPAQYERKRKTLREGREGMGAMRVFEFPRRDNYDPAVDFPRGSYFPGDSGGGRVVSNWDLDIWANAGESRLTVYYHVPTCEEWLELHAPKGVLLSRYGVSGQRKKHDLQGNLLEGIDTTDLSGKSVRQITSGSNVIYEANGTLRIHAVVNSRSVYRDQIMRNRWLGTFNSAPAPLMGNAGIGQLLLSSLNLVPRPYLSVNHKKLYTVDYDFLWRNEGWNEVCESTRFEYSTIKTKMYDNAGAVIAGETGLATVLVPTTDVQKSVMMKPWNMALLFTLLQNSW